MERRRRASAIEVAEELYARGRLDEARAGCEACLRAAPHDLRAWTLLGMVSIRARRFSDALAAFARAVELRPDDVEALANLGAAQLTAGQFRRAAGTFRRTIDLRPDLAPLHHNLARALEQCGDLAAAEASYRSTIALEPSRAAAHRDLGVVLEKLARPEEALACTERALALDPGDAVAHYNLGVILLQRARHEAAAAAFGRAIARQPEYAEAYNNFGIALQRMGHAAAAIASFDRALLLRPRFADALSNRGFALLERHLPEAALAAFEQALASAPEHPLALHGRASVLMSLQRHEEAAQCFARLVAARPGFDYAPGALFMARMYCCDWHDHAGQVDALRKAVRAGVRACQPFAFLLASDDAAEQRRCAELFMASECPPPAAVPSSGAHSGHERIRVAYLSADLHDHATAYLMAELFERHDRRRFEVAAVSFGPDADGPMRRRLRAAFEHFFDWRDRSDRAIAAGLREREIDIAVDLKGYTLGARPQILAHRPAPVQVGFLGYPGTSGAPYIDYLIADSEVVPESHQAHYSERIVYLPDCYQPNDGGRPIAARTPSRDELSLPEGAFVFCCFNSHYKITPTLFARWMEVLRDVADGVLWLLEPNPTAMRHLRASAERHGVDPQRLRFAPRLPLPEHLARYRCADLFLDTFPVNAHTTASDALWAGLPLLTCRGESFAARVAASLLAAVGLPELVTTSLEDYTARAKSLAHDRAELAALRARLERNRSTSPLFDAGRFCRHLEAAFEQMHERSRLGLPPVTLRVPATPSS